MAQRSGERRKELKSRNTITRMNSNCREIGKRGCWSTQARLWNEKCSVSEPLPVQCVLSCCMYAWIMESGGCSAMCGVCFFFLLFFFTAYVLFTSKNSWKKRKGRSKEER